MVDDVRDLDRKRMVSLKVLLGNAEYRANRLLPDRWEVGMKVRFLSENPWAWDSGQNGTVVMVKEGWRFGCEEQVFYTELDGQRGVFYTTTSDVEWLPELENTND